MPPTRFNLLTLLAVVATMGHANAGKLTTCQKAYFMIRQCASELADTRVAGPACCELLDAFDLRDCLHRDARLHAFASNKPAKAMKMLRGVCDKRPPAAASAAANADDAALEDAAKSVSKAARGDNSMVQDVASIAKAVLASGVNAEGGERDAVRAPLSALPLPLAGRGGVQEMYVIVEEELSGMCACEGAEGPAATDSAWRRAYLSSRLATCRFLCAHRRWVLAGLMLQMAAIGMWIGCLLVRPRWARSGTTARRNVPQFIVEAANPEWTEPLLVGDEEAGMSFGQR
jgi:hypothetical protein